MEERSSNYQIEISRNGQKVPVVNGVYLHSIYNPTKEAEAFATEHEEKLVSKNHVLILGLGFGYHVLEIEKKLQQFHGENYKIIVLEPSAQIVNDFNKEVGFKSSNISIISSDSVQNIFSNWTFVSFLMTRPLTLKHDSSFSLRKKFFTSFLSYQAPTNVKDISPLLNKSSTSLISHSAHKSIPAMLQESSEQTTFKTKEDYLLKAFNHICNI